MSSAPEPRDASRPESEPSPDPTAYPTHHVVAVIDTQDQLSAALAALTSGGFLESEIHYGTGAESADELAASTGRSGLASLLIRLAEHLGLTDEEIETKHRYEQAMRDNTYVVSVSAPTEERKLAPWSSCATPAATRSHTSARIRSSTSFHRSGADHTRAVPTAGDDIPTALLIIRGWFAGSGMQGAGGVRGHAGRRGAFPSRIVGLKIRYDA